MIEPICIFDIDGTIANLKHRLHHILPLGDEPLNWDKFHQECIHDIPIRDVIRILNFLAPYHKIKFFTGRNEVIREQTHAWIAKHTHIKDPDITMRPNKDRCQDYALKHRFYMDLSKEDRHAIVSVFEDRNQVVNMWRELGLTCFQVAHGDY